jgi:hypothetical protein
MVAVAGTPEAPLVIDRRRIVMADLVTFRGNQPYHAAVELPVAQAEQCVRSASESSRRQAYIAIESALRELRERGQQVVAASVLQASGRPLPELAAILKSHPLIHTAEGELYRESLAWAARECGLPVTRVREKELDAALLARVAPLGKSLGPPWTQDQKYAAAAAIGAL